MGTALEARLVPGDPRFEANREAMGAMVAELAALHEQVLEGGGERYVARHLARGKLLARQRLEALADPATPVLELSPLAGLETGDPLGGGMVVALAEVSGTQCLVIANDPTVRGGTTSPTTVRKLLRAMDVARDNRLPVVLLVESGGADLPSQADVFVPGGEQFRRLTQLSAAGIPTVCVVFGSSTAGGAYLPGDERLHDLRGGRAPGCSWAGPPLVKMAIGEDADEEELGGAAMHARVSGLCDYLARDEHEALRQARPRGGPPPLAPPRPAAVAARRSRRWHDPDELLGVAPADVRVPFDVREVLARLLDGSRFEEFKPAYGPQLRLRVGHPRAGTRSGVVANNGILFSEEARKGAQFIQLVQPQRHPGPLRPEHHRASWWAPATSRAGSSRTAPS